MTRPAFSVWRTLSQADTSGNLPPQDIMFRILTALAAWILQTNPDGTSM